MTKLRWLREEAFQKRRSEKWGDEAEGVIASTVAELDVELAPQVSAVLRQALDRHDLGYTPRDLRSLATAFAGFADRRLGWPVDPEQVVPVPDVMLGVTALCAALTEPGDAVAFAEPNYPPFFVELPRRLVGVGLRPDGALDIGALGEALEGGARVLALTSPHNPTGRVLPRVELEAIADLCATHGAWVLADEIHAPLTLDGATFTPFLTVSDAAREHGIALTSASKAFNLAALKCAVAVTASERARAALARLHMRDHVGLLGVLAAEAAFTDGDAWLDELLAALAANRDQLEALLAQHLPGARWTRPQAGFLAWLDCRGLGLGDDPAAALLRAGRVSLSPGHRYGPSGAGHVRLNYGTSPERLEELVRRMGVARPATA